MSKPFNWSKSCSYDEKQKLAFHRAARAALKRLADELGLPADSYDLRSNKAGIAVAGEVTLHGEAIYVQVSQSMMGSDKSVLIRTCNGRKDYTGGTNHFAPLSALDDPKALAAVVLRIAPDVRPDLPTPGEEPPRYRR